MLWGHEPMSGLDESGVLNMAPGELGECFAESCDTLRLHFKAALLRHGGIPAEK